MQLKKVMTALGWRVVPSGYVVYPSSLKENAQRGGIVDLAWGLFTAMMERQEPQGQPGACQSQGTASSHSTGSWSTAPLSFGPELGGVTQASPIQSIMGGEMCGSPSVEAEPQDPEAGSSQAMMVNYGKIPGRGCVFMLLDPTFYKGF